MSKSKVKIKTLVPVKPGEADIPVITSDGDPAEILAAVGVPLVGDIFPKSDPKYGHTFKMPPNIQEALKKKAK